MNNMIKQEKMNQVKKKARKSSKPRQMKRTKSFTGVNYLATKEWKLDEIIPDY